MRPGKRGLSPGLWTVVILAVCLLLWEWAAEAGRINTFFFSSPAQVWREFLSMAGSGLLRRHLLVTAREAVLGLLFGGVLGTLTGLALGVSKKAAAAVMSVMTGLNGLPKLALGPLIIIWFGIGITSKVLISALMVYFVFAFNLYAGVHSVDRALIEAAALLGGNRRQILGKVIWPSCLPWLLASLRTGLGLALSGAIVGEYLGAGQGLGWLISTSGELYNTPRVLCCVLVILVIMVILDGGVRLLEKTLLQWRE